MQIKRVFSAILALALVLSIGATGAFAAGDKPWYEKDYWENEKLLELGAELPTYNADTKQYEIGTPEQLLYLSGIWNPEDTNGDGVPDAPNNGTYVLTADLDMAPLMKQIGAVLTKEAKEPREGFMPPIGSETDQAGKDPADTKCAFFGTFDGQGYTISNARIERMGSKYAGLFGNIGHDYNIGFVRNLAVKDIYVKSLASCGLLAGAVYGDVDNCIVTGTIECSQKTAGGLAGKIKKNENGYMGTVRNSFVYADITVYGKGSENGAAGGVTSAQSDGGRIYNTYVGGKLTVLGKKATAVGGVSGNLNAGQALENTVMLLQSIQVEDGTDIGLLCGGYSGETGSHVLNNYVWEGTAFSGHVSNDHPETAAYESVDAATLLSKAFYADTLGWDFADTWAWVGDETRGYPTPIQFAGSVAAPEAMVEQIAEDLTVRTSVLRPTEPMVNVSYAEEETIITSTLTLPEGSAAKGASLYYGAQKDGAGFASVAMTDNGDGSYSVAFPKTAEGDWYYYLAADVEGETVTFPTDIAQCLLLRLLSADAKLAPKHITLSPGETYSTVGIAWITDEDGLTAELRYREAGAADWSAVLPVTDIYSGEVPGGRGAFTSYSVDLTGLAPATAYEYQAVTNDGAEAYEAEIGAFTTLPDAQKFSFLAISDLQSTTEEGYLPFLHTMNAFVQDSLGGTDFVVNLGDLTEDCSVPQWNYMFKTLGGYYANSLNAFVPGNHEAKGDPTYNIFKAHTNQPGGLEDEYIGETTGSFIVGDVCFVMLNTEPYSGLADADTVADKAAFYAKQKEWAQRVFEASGCSWRIVTAHAGLIQDDPVATEFLEKMCDELNVDLYFNGHIHNYYRATVREGKAVNAGDGTVFITTSPMGRKFDDFRPGTIDELLQFQTGGQEDARQYFTQVIADENGLTVTAYQLTKEGDDTSKGTFTDFTAIDSVQLTQSLSSRFGGASAGTAADDAGTQPKAGATIYIAAAVVVVLIAGAGIVIYQKKKKQA
ncbi:MAG: metallophosphoesterase family protein [Christensenellaceae bacterium]|jgi:predicted phosphodiesterase|nr:metallophosphoesterase family protein [Christensenellaceae bacterium]